MKKQNKINSILLIFLFVNLAPYHSGGQTEQNQDISIDISHITKNVNGFVIADNHFWILGSNETADYDTNRPSIDASDIINILYKVNSNGELVDSFELLEGSRKIEGAQVGAPFEYYSYTTMAFDGTNFLLYSGAPFLAVSGRSILFKYDTNGEHVEEYIIKATDPGRDRNIALGDNLLWVQTNDQIDAIDLNLDIPDFIHRYNHPGIGGTLIVKDILWGNNGLWIYYGGNDQDQFLINYDYINDETSARYSIDRDLLIHDIYYDGETFWMVQEQSSLLSIITYEPVVFNRTKDNNGIVIAIASLSLVAILGYSLRLIWLKKINSFHYLRNN